MYIYKKSADYALLAQAISREQIELSTSNLVCTLLIRFRTNLMEEFLQPLGFRKCELLTMQYKFNGERTHELIELLTSNSVCALFSLCIE